MLWKLVDCQDLGTTRPEGRICVILRKLLWGSRIVTICELRRRNWGFRLEGVYQSMDCVATRSASLIAASFLASVSFTFSHSNLPKHRSKMPSLECKI